MDGTGRRDWAMLVVLCLAAALSGILEILFVPLYVGSILFPIAVLFAVGGNLLLPRLGRELVDTRSGTVAPFLAWLLPVLVLALLERPEGDVLVAGSGGQQYVFYGVLLGGCLTGFITIVIR